MIVLLNTPAQSSCNAPMITHDLTCARLFLSLRRLVLPVILITEHVAMATVTQCQWIIGHLQDQLEMSEATSDACCNSFMPWLVFVSNK